MQAKLQLFRNYEVLLRTSKVTETIFAVVQVENNLLFRFLEFYDAAKKSFIQLHKILEFKHFFTNMVDKIDINAFKIYEQKFGVPNLRKAKASTQNLRVLTQKKNEFVITS